MKPEIKHYLKRIGAKGGRVSRRSITPEQQAKMQLARRKASQRVILENAKRKGSK